MAAVRMYFKKDVEGWDFGLFTMQLWLKTSFATAFIKNSEAAAKLRDRYDIPGLNLGFQNGEILFRPDQTVAFLLVIHKISEILVSDDGEIREIYFNYIKNKTDRFRNAEEFEQYYLACSSQVLQDVKEEFEKESILRRAFEKLISL